MNVSLDSLSALDLSISSTIECKLQEFDTLGKTLKKSLQNDEPRKSLDPICCKLGEMAGELISLQHTLLAYADRISKYEKLLPSLISNMEEIERKHFFKNKNNCII